MAWFRRKQRTPSDPLVTDLVMASVDGDDDAFTAAHAAITADARRRREARFSPTPIVAVALSIEPDDEDFLVARVAWSTPTTLVTEHPERLTGVRIVDGDIVVSAGDGAWSATRDPDSLKAAARGDRAEVAPMRSAGTPVDVVEISTTSSVRNGRARFTMSVSVGDTFAGPHEKHTVFSVDAEPGHHSAVLAKLVA